MGPPGGLRYLIILRGGALASCSPSCYGSLRPGLAPAIMEVQAMSSTRSTPSRHTPGDTPLTPEPRQPLGRGIGSLSLLLALALTGGYLAGPARLRMDVGTTGILLGHLGLG